jgi:DNA mismatch endonuclease (patch repair protein)
MAAISSTGNRTTELRLAKILRASSITGWRRRQSLIGKPDFLFRRERLAVFVDGCFWHGCPWHCRMPKSRQSYWSPKIARNKARDKAIRVVLAASGWRVYRIWEHSLEKPSSIVARLMYQLRKNTTRPNKRTF